MPVHRTVLSISWCLLGIVPPGSAVGSSYHRSVAAVRADTVSTDSAYAPPPATPWDSAGWSGRVVVGEYLTGTFCGGCQTHEQAFHAMLHRYPARAFIALAYHGTVNFPIADPVDSLWERMYAWYGDPSGQGSSMMPKGQGWDNWIDGHPTANGAIEFTNESGLEQATRFYRTMVTLTDAELRKKPEAVLHAEATPKGGTIVATVTVDSLASERSDVYVRILLVEDTVRLVSDMSRLKRKKANVPGPRLDHYMVVRLAARRDKAPLGLPLHGPGTVQYTFDVAKEQQRLQDYQRLGLSKVPGGTEWQKDAQDEIKQIIDLFPNARNWRMDAKRLHLVAFVQDAKTGEVLQAQMVPAHGEHLVLP